MKNLNLVLLVLGCAVGQCVSQSFNSTTAEAHIDCSGHSNGLYVRNPNECNEGFYKCSNGRSFYYRCPVGLYFGIEDAQCQYRQLIPACGGQRPIQITRVKTSDPVTQANNQDIGELKTMLGKLSQQVESALKGITRLERKIRHIQTSCKRNEFK